MPNHVQNKIVIPRYTNKIFHRIINKNGDVDFNILVPKPANVWNYSESILEEDNFHNLGLDWNRKNWGTKWNAYESEHGTCGSSLILLFQTAWSPPMDWICALWNTFKKPFTHLWMSEGNNEKAYFDTWENNNKYSPFDRRDASQEQHKEIHKLLCCVEEFNEEM